MLESPSYYIKMLGNYSCRRFGRSRDLELRSYLNCRSAFCSFSLIRGTKYRSTIQVRSAKTSKTITGKNLDNTWTLMKFILSSSFFSSWILKIWCHNSFPKALILGGYLLQFWHKIPKSPRIACSINSKQGKRELNYSII